MLYQQNSTTYPMQFTMLSASTGLPMTGLIGPYAPTGQVALNGATAFSPVAGTIVELGLGVYRLLGNAADRSVIGPVVTVLNATGALQCQREDVLVAYDPVNGPVPASLPTAEQDQLSTLAGGAGNAAADVSVTAAGAAVQNAVCSLQNSAGQIVATGTTGTGGTITLAAPAGDYTLTTTAAGYLGVATAVTLVAGANAQAVALTAATLPTPTLPDTCICSTTCVGPDGTPRVGVPVVVSVTAAPAGNGQAVSGDEYAVVSGANGLVIAQLVQGVSASMRAGAYGAPVAFTVPAAANFVVPNLLAK